MTEHQDRLVGLYAIENPTAKQLAEIEVREEALKVIGDKITEMNTFGVKDEDFYQDRIRGIAAARLIKKENIKAKTGERLSKAQETLADLEYDIAYRRMQLEAELEDLLSLPSDKVTMGHLRRMSYLEKKIRTWTNRKTTGFY